MIPFQGRSPILNIITNSCALSARKLLKDFGEIENLQVSKKGTEEFAKHAILTSQRVISEELLNARPNWGISIKGEPPVKKLTSDESWIINPLDGLDNFKHGIPNISISIAAKRADKIIAACIYDPIRKELFFAENGSGAYMNDRRIRVSGQNKLDKAIVGVYFDSIDVKKIENDAFLFKIANSILKNGCQIRLSGNPTLDLAWLASGRLNGFIGLNLLLNQSLSGVLIIKEAGGFCTDFSMRDKIIYNNEICAANPTIHSQMIKFFK